jgi:nicotinamide-nucleotide amidase
MDDELNSLASELGRLLLNMQWQVVTAESCTGGWIAQAITSVSGSSQWFDRGFISYSNASKIDMLAVTNEILEREGAVSAATAAAMAVGALASSKARISVAVTGIAGPEGGSIAKPVGTVWFGFAYSDEEGKTHVFTEKQQFDGDRHTVRYAAVRFGLKELITMVARI